MRNKPTCDTGKFLEGNRLADIFRDDDNRFIYIGTTPLRWILLIVPVIAVLILSFLGL